MTIKKAKTNLGKKIRETTGIKLPNAMKIARMILKKSEHLEFILNPDVIAHTHPCGSPCYCDLFDCYSVKYDWRFGPALLNIYRFATDVFALVGEKEFRAVMRGYCDSLNVEQPSKEIERFFVIYAALIMMPYLYMLGKTDTDKHEAAVKYHDFLKRYLGS